MDKHHTIPITKQRKIQNITNSNNINRQYAEPLLYINRTNYRNYSIWVQL